MSFNVRSSDPRQRFSSRVKDYVLYRPGYPDAVLEFLQNELGLNSGHVVADMGSGTGLSSLMFLNNGNRVYGIEPNREMREAGEGLLKKYKGFVSVDASAEETTLPDHSVDLIVAGQAFHWFRREECRKEFTRILKPGGQVILLWNDRHTDTTPFLREYESFLQEFGTDYRKVDHKNIDRKVLEEFFFPGKVSLKTFDNEQVFDYQGLEGRLCSSSYVPSEGQPGFVPMIEALKKLFDKHNTGGKVRMGYDTLLYYGKLSTG